MTSRSTEHKKKRVLDDGTSGVARSGSMAKGGLLQITKKPRRNAASALLANRRQQVQEFFRTQMRPIGMVMVHGGGECGELGLGDEITSKKKPAQLELLDDKQICQIAVGGLHNLALSINGKVYSWGCNDQRALGRGGDETVPALVQGLDHAHIVQVAAGDSISLALTSTGLVYAWGTFRDSTGILGFSDSAEIQETPILIKQLENKQIIKIVAGANHVFVLSIDHKLWTWGSGEQGQLGRKILLRHKKHSLTPHPLVLTKRQGSSGRIKDIFSGSYHAFAMDSNDRVFAWGLNNYGQLGVGDRENRSEPQAIQLTYPDVIFTQLEGGEHHSLALDRNGQVYSFGRGNYGQLGHGGEDDSLIPKRIMTLSGKSIIQIACGDHHSLALSKSGELYSWGYGEMFQLGNGLEADEYLPHHVEAKILENKKLLEIHGGAQHTVILSADT
jgi:regulator of chromosome condensation